MCFRPKDPWSKLEHVVFKFLMTVTLLSTAYKVLEYEIHITQHLTSLVKWFLG